MNKQSPARMPAQQKKNKIFNSSLISEFVSRCNGGLKTFDTKFTDSTSDPDILLIEMLRVMSAEYFFYGYLVDIV